MHSLYWSRKSFICLINLRLFEGTPLGRTKKPGQGGYEQFRDRYTKDPTCYTEQPSLIDAIDTPNCQEDAHSARLQNQNVTCPRDNFSRSATYCTCCIFCCRDFLTMSKIHKKMTVRARRPTPIADPTIRPTADPLESDSSNKADVPSPSSIPISWVQNFLSSDFF